MWQKLAKINLKGFIYNFDTEMLQKEEIINFINYIRLEAKSIYY